ncbi:hypothetical protein [Opitutus sp. ER46]|uniref:hypothetical protein n=1 Tax=Opitutus sp. ER46 TaxID=2161864 RepID=UPI000D32649C|nr:hypothetical protein [Opitutus sp. ER46]PTX95753.1 hypothetical protein DB354_10100 [Opitutus sp. ER46]
MKTLATLLPALAIVISGCVTRETATHHATREEIQQSTDRMVAEVNRELAARQKAVDDAARAKATEAANEKAEVIATSSPEIAAAIRAGVLVVGMRWDQARAAIGDIRREQASDGVGGSDEWYSHYGDAMRTDLYFHEGTLVRWFTSPHYR